MNEREKTLNRQPIYILVAKSWCVLCCRASYEKQTCEILLHSDWNLYFSVVHIYVWFVLHDVKFVVVGFGNTNNLLHVDVSEESEYDLWSDRFGSWIGRSSKSRSPDSMKQLRWERKSSSGYHWPSCSFVAWLMFLILFLARSCTPSPSSHLASCECFCFVFDHFDCARLGGVSSVSPDCFYEATGRRSSSGTIRLDNCLCCMIKHFWCWNSLVSFSVWFIASHSSLISDKL